MKTVLCISPHFPPANAADMHRLRQSLPYFEGFGWKAVSFVVDPIYIEQERDELLSESLPSNIDIHYVKAFPSKFTRKFGLGNLGFRSWFQYKNAVNTYLEKNKVDLIYFSTTVFTLMSLGSYWKNKYGVPFVVDLQDPWRNDYYLSLNRKERPSKFWFDYSQKKYLEAKTMPEVAGIVSVSDAYVKTMKNRYPCLKNLNCLTLPFSALESDWDIARSLTPINFGENTVNVIYVGRGGSDMTFSVSSLFYAFRKGLDKGIREFNNVRFLFFGTSYAQNGRGVKSFKPIAEKYGVSEFVEENTDRLPYFKSLKALDCADVLFIPGSNDEKYTASKVFPYILAKKPLFAIFNENSSVVGILKSTKGGDVISFANDNSLDEVSDKVLNVFESLLTKLPFTPELDVTAFKPYTAKEMTRKQCLYFDEIHSE